MPGSERGEENCCISKFIMTGLKWRLLFSGIKTGNISRLYSKVNACVLNVMFSTVIGVSEQRVENNTLT
jgi:uncharacterized membrane protein